jgi:FkbM family methyltransferase
VTVETLPQVLGRPGTQDGLAFYEVLVENEYRLPEAFDKRDVIVDVGAHIGCFALACLHRGARKVICYEPDPGNLRVLRRNLAPYRGRAEVHPEAVWFGDQATVHMSEEGSYTAMHSVVEFGRAVKAVRLDDVLNRFLSVRMLKLDCEGSEFPILRTSEKLRLVQEIVGEVHLSQRVHGWDDYSLPALRRTLENQGFAVDLVGHGRRPDLLNWLFARRKKSGRPKRWGVA